MVRFFALPTLLAASIAVASPVMAATVRLEGHFQPEHATTSHPEGTVRATLDTHSNLVKYTLTWTGLSGPVVAAHFHGPASASEEAGVLVPIPAPYKSGQHGSVLLSSEQAQALQNGQVYVNLHTAALPNGEARAQLAPVTPGGAK